MKPKHKISCLSRVPIFAHLTEEEKEQVHAYLRPAHFSKGDFVVNAGLQKPRLMVLNRGKAKVSRVSKDGREQIIRLLQPGDYVSELAVFTGQPSSSDVVATEESSFCVLDQSHLHELLADKPKLAVRILADLSSRLEQTKTHVKSLGLNSAYDRLYEALFEMSEGRGSFTLPISKKDLAARIGVTPETLSRTLKKLEADGRLSINGKNIAVLN